MWSHWYSSEAKLKHALCALGWIGDQGQNSFSCQLWETIPEEEKDM